MGPYDLSIAHQISQFAGRTGGRYEHSAYRFPHIGRNAKRQACDDGAAGEYFGIGGEHDRCHGAAGGKPGDEYAMPIDAYIVNRRAIICLIEQASPLSRAVSSGLNQLKQPLALLNGCCWGISNAKPKCFARVDQPAPKS